MAKELSQKLLLRLHSEQLSYRDLPVTEELIWGTLKELGFDSYLDRTKLCKLIIAKRHEDAVQYLPTDTTTALGPNGLTITNADGLLSEAGQRGLAVACRSAHTMALTVCQTTEDASLWLQMPRSVTTIGTTTQAYEITQETP